MIILTRSMIDINVVLIADRIEKKENMDSYDLEKISDEYFKQIHGALERVCKNVIHYNSLVDFIDNIEKHKHDLVFSIYGGEKSRNRLALVPAICEAYDIKFIGPDAYDRIICQDKDISKELAKKLKLKTPKSITVLQKEKITNHIFNNLNFPVVVKPLYEGSSIGINEHSFCKDITSTVKRLNELQHQHKQAILVEEFISGKEIVTCFVGNQNTLNCMEIVEVCNEDDDNYFNNHLYTGSIKHNNEIKTFHKIITNNVDTKIVAQLKYAFHHFNKMDYMRIDGKLFNNEFYFIEFTPDASLSSHCSFKDIYESQGKNYDQLIEDIIKAALDDYGLL